MSTVLKAVQEIERRATPLAASVEPRDDDERRPWPLIALGVVGLGILAAIVASLAPLGQEDGASPVVVTGSAPARVASEEARVAAPPAQARVGTEASRAVAPVARVAAEAPRAVAPPPPVRVAAEAPAPARVAVAAIPAAVPAPVVEEEAPRGEVVMDTSVPAAPRAVAKAPPRAEASEERPRLAAVERRPRIAAVAPPPAIEDEGVAAYEPVDPEPAPKRAGNASSPLPRVDVRAIGYSSRPEARTVTLRVGGGPAVTMHEGESMNGVDVQLIMPGSVYLRHGGSIFALSR